MKNNIFFLLALNGFLAAIWLKFFTQGWLRGNLYDLVLVAFLASATFFVKNLALVQSARAADAAETVRVSQIALNKRVTAAWILVGSAAEIAQGFATLATGNPALGTFDPLDLVCYAVGALVSFCVNTLLYLSDVSGAR